MSYVNAGGDPARLELLSAIGRMNALGDGKSRCLAGIHPDLPGVGAIGDWVGADDVRIAAERWLVEQGCTVIRGPMELCTWFSYRANLGPHEQPPFLMEPVEPPDRWRAAGYTACAQYASTLVPHDAIITANLPTAARLQSAGWAIESLPKRQDGTVPEAAFVETVAIIHRIAHQAFADAFGFARLPLDAMQALYAPYRAAVDPDLVFLAIAPSGEVAGFLFGLPDHAVPARRWAIIKTIAVEPKYAGERVGSWMMGHAHDRFRRKGYTAAVHALMWSESNSTSWSRHGGAPLRRYELLQKPASMIASPT